MTTNQTEKWLATSFQKAAVLTTLEKKGTSLTPPYVMQFVFDLPHIVNATKVAAALKAVTKQNSNLRTQFKLDKSQVWLYHIAIDEEFFDISENMFESWEASKYLLRADYAQSFEFASNTPLWRTLLLKCEGQYRLAVTIHHAIFDDRSVQLFVNNFMNALYGNPKTATSDSLSLETYLEKIQKIDFSRLKESWVQLVSEFSNGTTIQSNQVPIDSSDGALRFPVSLEADSFAALDRFQRLSKLKTADILMAAWAVVLSRLAGETRVSFGVVRSLISLESRSFMNIMGPMIETLPFLIEVPTEGTCLDYCVSVSGRMKEWKAFENCPREKLLDWSGLETPELAFSSIYNYTATASKRRSSTNIIERARFTDWGHGIPLVPTLGVKESGGKIILEIICPPEYSEFCKSASEIYHHVLNQLIAPDAEMAKLRTYPDLHETFLEGSLGQSVTHAQKTLQEVIETSLEAHPDGLAFDGSVQITYGDLKIKSAALAGEFWRKIGVRKHSRIVILLPPGPSNLVAVTAAARSGYCFICINPDAPSFDIQKLLNAINPELVILNSGTFEAKESKWNILYMEDIDLSVTSTCRVVDAADENDIGYLVHTSGTTARPKIIQIEQHSAANSILNMVDIYKLGPGDRRWHFANPGADFFLAEVLATLASGATLVKTETSNMLTPSEFLRQIDRLKISVVGVPSSYWRGMVRSLDEDADWVFPASLRQVNVGMETVDPNMLKLWKKHVPASVDLLNVYGPAEATMLASTCFLNRVDIDDSNAVPIGVPIANTALYILDFMGHPVPSGAKGEICLAGRGIMSGYLHGTTPQLSKNNNSANPSFQRLYQTGDYGYRRPDGQFVFVGRRDRQVKIRGYRIELDEVESKIAALAKTAPVAIEAVESAGKSNAIICFIETDDPDFVKLLKNRIGKTLRKEFIPKEVMNVTKFPRLGNGKLDRAALRDLYKPRRAADLNTGDFDQQNRPTISQMILLWNRVLETTDCNADSDFFDSGGDSLRAIELSMLTAQFMRDELPLEILYKERRLSSVVESMSSLDKNDEAKIMTAPPQLDQASDITTAMLQVNPLIYETQRTFIQNWEGEQTNPDSMLFTKNTEGNMQPLFWCFQGYEEFQQLSHHLGSSHPVTGMRSGHLFIDYDSPDLQALASRYASEITQIQPTGELVIGGNCQGGYVALAAAAFLRSWGRRIDRLILLDDDKHTSFPCHISLIYGQESTFNPYKDGRNPEATFSEAYGKSYDLSFVPGGHGQYFSRPSIRYLAAKIKSLLRHNV